MEMSKEIKQFLQTIPWKKFAKWAIPIIAATILVAMLNTLLAWIRLTPTAKCAPSIFNSGPINIYDKGVVIDQTNLYGWWQPIKMSPQEMLNIPIDFDREEWFEIDTNVSLEGHVTLLFDLESVADRYRVMIDHVDVAVERTGDPDNSEFLF